MQNTMSLIENNDFKRLYKKGKSAVMPALVLYIAKNCLSVNRLGITTSKKIGKAHERNRARRIIKEAYRSLELNVRCGFDIVIVARTRTIALKTGDVQRVMKGILSSFGVLIK